MPNESRLTTSESLFFHDIVRSYTDDPRYLRRDWLAGLIAQKLAHPYTRYVVVTGAPGSGKSSLIAQLAGDYPRSLIYLLRRDQRTSLAEGSAKSFLVRAGLQFSSLHPQAFDTDAITLEVTQSAKTASANSEIVGAKIGRLIASPFYQSIVRVRQQVGTAEGQLTGVEIDEIVSDPRLLAVSDLQELALWVPAELLLEMAPSERVIILVDALDELVRHAPSEEVDLVKWLHDQPEIPANVRFVLTSRPSSAVNAFLEKQAPFVALVEINPSDKRVTNDVASYTSVLASQMRTANVLADHHAERRFVEEAGKKAAGNLGYVGALARAFDQALTRPDRHAALESLLKLDSLPDSQEDLYAFFFHELKRSLGRQNVEIEGASGAEPGYLPVWPAVYQKALAVLSIGYESLTADQIADLAQIAADRAYVVNALDDLEQFLRRDTESRRMSFYHPTVAEFLTAATTRDDAAQTDLFVDSGKWNARVAALLDSRFAKTPDALDDYALKYRIRHQLAGAGPEPAYAAMTPAWMLFKRARTGDDRSFHADMMQVVQSLRRSTPLDIVAMVRCCLIDSMLLARADVLPAPIASIWAICGQRTRADSLISLISAPAKRAAAFLELAHGLAHTGAIHDARDALRSAVTAAKTNAYYGDRLTTLQTVLSASVIDGALAASVLDVATMTGAAGVAGDELGWEHQIVATIYERAAPLVPAPKAAELRTRLEEMLKKPGDGSDRASILISAARVSDVLGRASDAASFAELGLAAIDKAPGIATIRALCESAYRLKELTDQKWASQALARAQERLKGGLNSIAEVYAVPLIVKSALDTAPGFDLSQLDFARSVELARSSRDAAVFRLFAEIYAAQGDAADAAGAADLCYQAVLASTGRNQVRFTGMVSDAVIAAFRATRHRSGLLQLLDAAALFRSPGSEWERDQIVEMVSNAAVLLGFTDVLDRAVVVAQETRNIWERASALSRVGKAYAMTGDKPRALSIARSVEDTVAGGLRSQFPQKRVRGALLLAAAIADPAQPMDAFAEQTVDPRYLAVARALTAMGPSLKSTVEMLSKYDVAPLPLYTLVKKAVVENDAEALEALENWEKETPIANTKWDIQNLRGLVTSSGSDALITKARQIVESFDRLDVIPEAALIVVDALVKAGLVEEAASIVAGLAESARRPRADAQVQVAWEAAAFLASHRLNSAEDSQSVLVTLLDRARDTGMARMALTVADTAPAIAVLFGTSTIRDLLTTVDEAATVA